MKTARAAAVLTWIYAAAFGLPATPISAYLVAEGTCRRSWGLYGDPGSARVEPRTFVALPATELT
ncbi:MAG TPA: hypothetical protein VF086_05405 [Propionibacteriaceae bacterium]